MPNVIRFIQEFEDTRTEKTVANNLTWTELSEHYLEFLKGCGYHLEAQDLADYFSELAGG